MSKVLSPLPKHKHTFFPLKFAFFHIESDNSIIDSFYIVCICRKVKKIEAQPWVE